MGNRVAAKGDRRLDNAAAQGASFARKMVALVLNVLVPGVGTMVIPGKFALGVVQLVVEIIGRVLQVAPIASAVGDAIAIAAWVWAVVTSILLLRRRG